MENTSVQKDLPKKSSGQLVLPFLIFILAMLVALFVTFFVSKLINEIRQAEFTSETVSINKGIVDRLEIYTNTLHGARGLFDASEEVSREEWRAYVESLNLQEHYPGVQGVGYSVWIDPSTVDEHVNKLKEEGFPDYTIRPEGVRAQYTSIIYLEPFDERNSQAFGFDMYQEATRRDGMDRARFSGNAAMSGRVTLVQEITDDVQSGFLIYVPVYEKSDGIGSADGATLAGFVYSAFRMGDFMQGIVTADNQEDIGIEIFDSAQIASMGEEERMYGKPLEEIALTRTEVIDFGGRRWLVRYSAPTGYHMDIVRLFAPVALFATGLLLSFLFAFITYVFNTRRFTAVQLATSMTADLQKRTQENERIQAQLKRANENLKNQTQTLSEKMQEVERVNKYMVDREVQMIDLKNQIKQLRESK